MELLGDDRQIDLKAAGLSNRGASPEDYPYDIGRLKASPGAPPSWPIGIAAKISPRVADWGSPAVDRSSVTPATSSKSKSAKRDRLSIPKVWVSLDCGLIVSPDRVRAQVEGAAIMATTQVRYGKITFKNGRVQQSNYDDYTMATMSDCAARDRRRPGQQRREAGRCR